MCARCSGGRGGCGRVASGRRGRAERGKCGAAAGAPSFLSGVLVPAPRRREREGERAGCSRRGPRRGCPRCSGRRQQVGQPGWPRNISSACGLPGSGLPVPGLSVPAPPSRVTPQAASSGGNFAGAPRRRSWAWLCGSGEPRARGFPEKGSPGAGRAVGAGSLVRLALVGVIPRFVLGRSPGLCWGAASSEKVSEKILWGFQRAGSPEMSPLSGGSENEASPTTWEPSWE